MTDLVPDSPSKVPPEFQIVPRIMWNAYPPLGVTELTTPVQYVFCMNTHTPPCDDDAACEDTVRRIQQTHINKQKHPDIRYNFQLLKHSFLIGDDGNVYEGRGWNATPDLPMKYSKYNSQSIVLAFIGEYIEDTLSDLMKEMRDMFVDYGIEKNYIRTDFSPIVIFDRYG